MIVDRPFPHDIEAERALLGSIMLAPWKYRDICELISAESFHHPAHGTIWDVIADLSDMQGIDLITLHDRLITAGKHEEVGGLPFLSGLLEATPTAANVSRYAHIVADKAARREIIRMSLELQESAFDGDDTAMRVDACMERLNALQHAKSASDGRFQSLADLMPGVVDYVQALQESDDSVLGITTGYADIDRLLRMRAGEMIVLAARPSIGKSALMYNMARAQAEHGIPVGIFSYEMSAQSLARRALFAEVGINPKDLENGILSPGAWAELMEGAGRLKNAPVYIDERKGNLYQLRARSRRMVERHGVRAIYIDYLQLIPETKQSKDRNRENAVAQLSSGVKSLAQELDIPVVILAQLNREAESQKKQRETLETTRPRLSHLRESGAIEQDADVVMLLHRLRGDDGASELLIEKHRNGPTGIVSLLWQAQYTRFVQAERRQQYQNSVSGDEAARYRHEGREEW